MPKKLTIERGTMDIDLDAFCEKFNRKILVQFGGGYFNAMFSPQFCGATASLGQGETEFKAIETLCNYHRGSVLYEIGEKPVLLGRYYIRVTHEMIESANQPEKG